jgi:hypothetical protein
MARSHGRGAPRALTFLAAGWLTGVATTGAHETETTGIGARSTALAGAVTASVAASSAVYFNPASLAHIQRAEAWLDVTSFTLVGDSNSPDAGDDFDFSLDPFIVRPTLILTGPLFWDDWSWGFGILGVSGLASRFPADFGENRFSSASAKILQTTLTPSMGWRVTERLSTSILFAFPPGDLHLGSFGAFFPRLLDRVDVGLYLQVGILGGRHLSAGESVNGGGLKRPFFDDEGRIAFAPNDVAIHYERGVLSGGDHIHDSTRRVRWRRRVTR